MQSQKQKTKATSQRQKKSLNQSNRSTRSWILAALLAAGLGGATGLGCAALDAADPSSSGSVAIAAGESELPSIDSLSNVPQPQLQGSSTNDSVLSSEVSSARIAGTAQSYNDMDELVDYTGVDPFKSQTEQGLNDRSGLTYPCVFSFDSPDVCQRRLTADEAARTGY